MDPPLRLRDYPYVVVRFACRDCPRLGRYRLAVLAERFGAEVAMVDILEAIAGNFARNRERHPGRRCQAYLPTWSTRGRRTCRRRSGGASGCSPAGRSRPRAATPPGPRDAGRRWSGLSWCRLSKPIGAGADVTARRHLLVSRGRVHAGDDERKRNVGEFMQRLIDAEQKPEALLVNVQTVGAIGDHFRTVNGEVNEKIDPSEPDKAGRKKPEDHPCSCRVHRSVARRGHKPVLRLAFPA